MTNKFINYKTIGENIDIGTAIFTEGTNTQVDYRFGSFLV
jgi:hypothetical protein